MKSKKTQNEFYNKKENRVIYVLLFPSENIFYINQCRKNSLKETYRHNIKGRRVLTKSFVNKYNDKLPFLFVIEELNDITKSEAFNYIIVWLKILIENGYTSYNCQNVIELTNNLFFQNQQLYEQRKNSNISKLFANENIVFPKTTS